MHTQTKNLLGLCRSNILVAALFLFFIFTFTPANAQINNNRFRVNLNSLDMGPCGGANDAHSRIAVTAKNNTVHNFEIAFDLPDGVNYIPGSERITFQSGSSDFTLTVVDMSDLNAPVFRLERPSDANWQVADRVRFRFDKTASCDAVQFSYAGGLFKDEHTITYDDLNGPQSVSDTDPTINSYNFLRAYLAVQNYNTVNAAVGDNITRTLEVTNSGNGTIDGFIHNVAVGADLATYTLSFNGTPLTPTISGNVYRYSIDSSIISQIGDNDTDFENETVLFEESFTVNGCADSNISHQPIWGCSPTEICQTPLPFTGSVIVNTDLPNLVVTKINNVGHTDLCSETTYTAHVANTSTTAIAYNVAINTGFGYTSYITTTPTRNALWGNDFPDNTKSISNFRFAGQPNFTPTLKPNTERTNAGTGSYFVPEDFFNTDPDGAGGFDDLDGDGFFDDLAPGASTDLLYDYANNARSTTCGTSGFEYVRTIQTMVDAYAQNQCDTYTPTYRRFMNNPYLSRGAVNTSAPNDLYDGTPFTIGIQGSLSAPGTDKPYCNGVRMFSNDPNSSYTVTLNVPTGILLDGTPADFTQVDANTIVYSTTNLPTTDYLNMNVQFPLTIDCGTYSGPNDVSISYTTRYECSCFAEDIHCGTISGVRAQCGGPCDGPAITNFEAQRETAGWTDDSMSTTVTLDPNVHNTETYMAKDQMVIQADAVINNANPNNLYFDVTYSTVNTGAGGSDIINFLNGTISINDLSSGIQSTAITGTPTLLVDSPDHYRLRFDLSGYTNIISPTYTYGEPLIPLGAPENDTVHLELHFEFEENFTDRTLYELEDFAGDFFNFDGTGGRVSCNILGDRAYYFKNRVHFYDRASTSASGCTPEYIELLAQILSPPAQFPGEYRPPVIWQSTDVNIPAGAEFTGLVTSSSFPGTPPTTLNGGLIATQSGNVVTVSPGPSLREWNQGSDRYPRIRVHFRGSPTSPPSTTTSWTANYTEFPYASAPVNKSRTDTHPFNFQPPTYTLTSTTPVVSGDQATAIFETSLCNTSGSTIDFNWVQINNGSDFTVTRVFDIAGGIETAIPFTSSGGATWVELGAMPDCRQFYFEVDYTNCSNFNFTLENSWSCTGYPSDFSTATYANPLNLRLEPKEAVLQIAIIDQPAGPVDICSSFDIDLELRNAGNGDLVSPSLTFDIPGDATSLTLNDIRVRYPRNAATTEPVSHVLTGNTVTINLLDHSQIAANTGIQGSLNAGTLANQIAILELDLSVACNFTSNTAITYTANGNNTCGTPATGNGSRLSTNPIVVNGAVPNYDAISTIAVPSAAVFAGCTTETITVNTTIVGGPTSNLDYARIILPDGLAFDASTFVSNNPTYPVTYASVSTVGNHEEIIVNMPDGANNGADPSYSFDVTPKNTSNTCSPGTRIQVDNYVVTSALSCGGTSCGTTEIANGSTYEDIIITKPELVESAFTSNSDYTTDGAGNYEYHIQFGVENTGTVDIASGFIYDVYCADGSGAKTGTSIYGGIVAQAIPAGNSITEDITFTTSNFCGDSGNMVVEFVPSSTNCHCDVLSIPLVSEPEMADIEVLHTVDTPNVYIGDTVTFSIEVSNNGPFDAEQIEIEDIVPGGFTIGTVNNGGTASGNTINWPDFNLAMGTNTVFTFTATVNTPTGTPNEYTNMAQVIDVNEYDPDSTPNNYTGTPLEDDEAIATVNILTADLSIVKSIAASSNSNPTIGETVIFEVIITNNGPDDANNVSLEDMLPSGFTLNTASISSGGVATGNTIHWDVPVINSGQSLTKNYEVTINVPTTDLDQYTNIAQVTASDEYDPNSQPNNYDPNRALENDEAVYTTNVQSADLEIINTISATTVSPGDAITVSVEVINNGPNDATNMALENYIPVGFTVTNISNGGSQAGNTITWNGLNIPNGTNIILTFDVTINVPTNIASEYLNIVQVTDADQYDLDSLHNNDDGDQSEDDEDNASVALLAANLSLVKALSTASNQTPNTGDTVTFELTLTNNGPEAATNVTLQDNIPSGYNIGTINDGGVLSGSTLTWNLASVPVGSQTFSYEVTLNTPTNTTDEYRNTAQVTASDLWDPNSTPNNDDGDQSEDDEASFTIAAPTVDLEITKTVDKTQSFFEDTLVFTVTVTNNSSYDATNIGIEDVLPNGFALDALSVDLGTFDEAISTWEIPLLSSNVTATLTMTVTVTETVDYTNVAQLIYLDQIDDNMANDRDEASVEVTQEQCLTVFNEFSPNNDGANDVFFIECIEKYPNNVLQVFNRWGTKVFEMQGYNNSWDGTSTGRATINAPDKLPVGTYYYTLEPNDGETPAKAGWLYISR